MVGFPLIMGCLPPSVFNKNHFQRSPGSEPHRITVRVSGCRPGTWPGKRLQKTHGKMVLFMGKIGEIW